MNRTEELIKSDEFVKEPVDKIINSILGSDKKKVILVGGPGSGKSVVLNSFVNKNLGEKEKTIYHIPEVLPYSFEKDFSSDLINYWFELYIAARTLNYIKKNYPKIHEEYFEDDNSKVYNRLEMLNSYMRFCEYKKKTIETDITTGDITIDVLRRFREIAKIDKLNWAIERFDSTSRSTEYTQKLYEKYFALFDKVVLISNDTSLDKNRLENNGYSINELTYGKDKDVLREIILRRIRWYNKTQDANVYEELFTRDLFINKLDCTDGDIELAISILFEFIRDLSAITNDDQFEKGIDGLIQYRLETHNVKQIRLVNNKSTLYL